MLKIKTSDREVTVSSLCCSNPNLVPGEQASPRDPWPLHTPERREYLELNVRHLGATDRWSAIGTGPRVKECAFWAEYLPDLISSAGQGS